MLLHDARATGYQGLQNSALILEPDFAPIVYSPLPCLNQLLSKETQSKEAWAIQQPTIQAVPKSRIPQNSLAK